jgi:hypothetical protein
MFGALILQLMIHHSSNISPIEKLNVGVKLDSHLSLSELGCKVTISPNLIINHPLPHLGVACNRQFKTAYSGYLEQPKSVM